MGIGRGSNSGTWNSTSNYNKNRKKKWRFELRKLRKGKLMKDLFGDMGGEKDQKIII